MHIEQIWRYPVKSMVGGRVDSAEVGETGIVGDRTWAVRDQVRGGIRGAKVLGGLMQLSARYAGPDGGPVVITLPDGRTVSTDDPDAAAVISAAIDHEVTLEPLHPPEDLEHYRRGAAYHDDPMEELRSIFGRTEDEPLPDLSAFPPVIFEHESPPGTYYDAFPLLLLTTSALRSLQEALPESAIDIRRFRPSVVVDTGDEPGHPELAWTERRIQIGDVTPRDRSILRHLVKDLGQNVGVYAKVVTPGTIRAGDSVSLVE